MPERDRLAPKAQYPPQSTFGQRIQENVDDKIRIAKCVVDKFLQPGQSAFIADGSTTLYVALEAFQRGHLIEIYTNNLSVAHEAGLWKPQHEHRVSLAGGDVFLDLFLVGGRRANKFVRRIARECQLFVLSVNAIFGEQGPTGAEPSALQIKRAAVEAGNVQIIFLADHAKLSQKQPRASFVYRSPREWKDAAASRRIRVIAARCPESAPPDWQERYTANRKVLNDLLNGKKGSAESFEGFIEV